MEENLQPIFENRALTSDERLLVQWMLEHGELGAELFLPQIDQACIVSRCPCGCASVDFEVDGLPQPNGGLHILSDYLLNRDEELAGVFIFERGGVLAGIEVYGLSGDAPSTLPRPEDLSPFDAYRN